VFKVCNGVRLVEETFLLFSVGFLPVRCGLFCTFSVIPSFKLLTAQRRQFCAIRVYVVTQSARVANWCWPLV
jgi:hypothetical protein